MAVTNKVREELAKRFQEALSQGKLPWESCWSQDRPQNAVTNTRYRGVNAIWLSYVAQVKGYADPRWCTFKQAENKGWHIQKGQKATYVEYWAYFDREKKKLLSWKDANEILRTDPQYAEKNLILTSKVFAVFNGEQLDGIPRYEKSHQTDIGELRAQRDTLIANMGIGYREEGQRAYYSPSSDCVTLPPEATFDSTYGYMATFLHECGHATGHSSRMDRPLDGYYGNPESYAKEELRAEIASAFTVQELGLHLTLEQTKYETERHIAYVQSWAAEIKKAPEALFQAIKDAEKISDYLIEKGEFRHVLENTQEIQAKTPQHDTSSDRLAELLSRMENSLQDLSKSMLQRTPLEALQHSQEMCSKEDILSRIEQNHLIDTGIQNLLSYPDPLETLYTEYVKRGYPDSGYLPLLDDTIHTVAAHPYAGGRDQGSPNKAADRLSALVSQAQKNIQPEDIPQRSISRSAPKRVR